MRGVTHAFGQNRVLSDVSLSAAPGELTVIYGDNGTGKSTLMRLAAGLCRPLAGTVSWDENPASLTHHAGRNLLGLNLTDGILQTALTVRQNIGYFTSLRGIDEQAVTAAAHEAGVGHRFDHQVRQLSSGQRRRFELILAFAHQPALILLDEPQQHLDTAGNNWVATQITTALKRGAAVLVTLPTGIEIGNLSARSYRLAEGKCVAA